MVGREMLQQAYQEGRSILLKQKKQPTLDAHVASCLCLCLTLVSGYKGRNAKQAAVVAEGVRVYHIKAPAGNLHSPNRKEHESVFCSFFATRQVATLYNANQLALLQNTVISEHRIKCTVSSMNTPASHLSIHINPKPSDDNPISIHIEFRATGVNKTGEILGGKNSEGMSEVCEWVFMQVRHRISPGTVPAVCMRRFVPQVSNVLPPGLDTTPLDTALRPRRRPGGGKGRWGGGRLLGPAPPPPPPHTKGVGQGGGGAGRPRTPRGTLRRERGELGGCSRRGGDPGGRGRRCAPGRGGTRGPGHRGR